MTNEPMRATMRIDFAQRVDPPTGDEPMIRCSVCGQQRRFEGFARVVITPNEVVCGLQDYVEDMPLCESCLDRPDVLAAVARIFHPENVESDGGNRSVH